MPARLTVHLPDRPAQAFLVDEGRDYIVGRGAESDLRLDDDRISRRHARLAGTAAGGWRIADLGSKNGIAVGGVRVDAAALPEATWLSFGGLLARFEPLSEAARRRESEERLERWRSSIELGRRLSPLVGLDELLRRLMDSVLRLSGAERGFVLLARGDDGELEIATAVGVDGEALASPDFSGSVGAVERTLAQERPVVIANAQADAALGERASIVAGGIQAVVCVPLRSMERLIGVIYADSRTAGASFTELDVEILEAFSSHAGLAVTVARMHQELEGLAAGIERAAELPPETGERLRADLDRAWQRSVRPYRRPASAAAEPRPDARTTWSGIVTLHRRVAG